MAVVGGGMVGLCVAWFLQERGVGVTVLERDRVTPGPVWGGAGASWGSAGWLTPGLATPLPEPAVLRYGLRMLLRPDSPVYLPPAADPALGRFLAGFVAHSTHDRWRAAMRALSPLTRRSLDAFDDLADGGVAAPTRAAAPFLACYRDQRGADALLAELDDVRACGQPVDAVALDPLTARDLAPLLSDQITHVVQVHGQRYCDPGRFVAALADAVRERGGIIREGVGVDKVIDLGSRVVLALADHTEPPVHFDAVVLATGAWLPRLAARYGVRSTVQAGRGYSFTAAVEKPPTGPIYFPASRVACTPIGDGLRIAGMMEFRRPDAAPDPRRVDAIAAAAGELLRGVDLRSRTLEWVGPRPCTPDGLPLVGPTSSPRVHVAGGHGMWGITLGPITGRLVAEALVDGRTPPELAPFDPLRGSAPWSGSTRWSRSTRWARRRPSTRWGW
ncbi:FAD dependent oxidoreductase [Parafrankia sp. Ea1.12]|uniref:NAD(P)/FAD-dependent oxidoreductase n=1 Tax=Parafrankia sp. Ea1.12 TaxID=573499 RepID=UPI000DA5B16C|nr:FAD-dependent oxidoreductase [Parafrankia sp. Ea1.12]SQD96345.1 FAD dependent oxidoreductase [Parafrankia sp. Ea1.12]